MEINIQLVISLVKNIIKIFRLENFPHLSIQSLHFFQMQHRNLVKNRLNDSAFQSAYNFKRIFNFR